MFARSIITLYGIVMFFATLKQKFFKKIKRFFAFASVLCLVLWSVFSYQVFSFDWIRADKEHKIFVFPEIVSSDAWENDGASLIQDLREDSSANDFSETNSAWLVLGATSPQTEADVTLNNADGTQNDADNQNLDSGLRRNDTAEGLSDDTIESLPPDEGSNFSSSEEVPPPTDPPLEEAIIEENIQSTTTADNPQTGLFFNERGKTRNPLFLERGILKFRSRKKALVITLTNLTGEEKLF